MFQAHCIKRCFLGGFLGDVEVFLPTVNELWGHAKKKMFGADLLVKCDANGVEPLLFFCLHHGAGVRGEDGIGLGGNGDDSFAVNAVEALLRQRDESGVLTPSENERCAVFSFQRLFAFSFPNLGKKAVHSAAVDLIEGLGAGDEAGAFWVADVGDVQNPDVFPTLGNHNAH